MCCWKLISNLVHWLGFYIYLLLMEGLNIPSIRQSVCESLFEYRLEIVPRRFK